MFRTRFCLVDLLISVGVVLIAVAMLLFPSLLQEEGERLVIVTPTERTEYPLNVDRCISLHSEGVDMEIVIENGEVFVRRSSCRDGVCTASGRIARAGQSILCAPAGVTLLIEGGDGDVDFVAG